MSKKIDESVLDELLRGCERPEDLLGDGRLMKDLKKALMQRMLGAELTEHLGCEHGEEPPLAQTNRRNGAGRKRVMSEDGALEIEAPRDREGSFEPRLIAKGQTRIDGLDDKSEPRGRHWFETRGERAPRPGHERARHPGSSRGPPRPGGLAGPDQPRHRRGAGRGEGVAGAGAGRRLRGGDLRRSPLSRHWSERQWRRA
jgi:hypothetical protein